MIQKLTKTSTLPFVPVSSMCPACGNADGSEFFEALDLPVHVCVLGTTAEEAKAAPRGDIRLVFCHDCGLVYNRVFDLNKLSYQPGYDAKLTHSATFCAFMEGVADRLIRDFALTGKTILEIGCGCGYFLRLLCERGRNNGIGVDPASELAGTEQLGSSQIRFERRFFGRDYGPVGADFVCCLSVFEHIPNPLEFLSDLRQQIGDAEVGIYFEIFHAFEAFRRQQTWSILYEQCNYFSENSFPAVFRRAGFEVLRADTCYEDGQYLFVDGTTRRGRVPKQIEASKRLPLPDEVREFSGAHQRNLDTWTPRLYRYREEGRRVVFWGIAGKGVSFLNMLPTQGVIEYAVDNNAARQGLYVPGSGQPVMHPDFLRDYQPDVIILSNPLYLDEIRQQCAELGVDADFLTA